VKNLANRILHGQPDRGEERTTCTLTPAPIIIVDPGGQLLGGVRAALLDSREDLGDSAH
jgi:hypothetical protein